MRYAPAAAILPLALMWVSCSTAPHPETHSDGSTGTAAVPLFEDLGTHRFPVSTANAQAQQYMDQGMRLLYGFNHDEAERSFREAARLDPNLAMAWWGVALALGPNINLPLDDARNQRAVEAIRYARERVASATPREKDYVDALAVRYSADPGADRAALDQAYARAMKALAAKYPDDTDASTLYAESMMDLKPWRLWSLDGQPAEGTLEILRVLEGTLERNPGHPGANHYYIHAIEASPEPAKGAAAAKRLETLVPGAGHLVHMPAHIHIRTGNFDGAVDANARAVKADEAYIARTNAQGVYPMMYYTHNFMFLSTAASLAGRTAEALEAAKKAVAIAAPMAGHDAMAEYVLPWTIFTLARNARWDDLLRHEKPSDATPSTLAFWHYGRTLSYLAKGDRDAAGRERTAYDEARGKVPESLSLNLNSAKALLDIGAHVLDGRMAGAANRHQDAVQHWLKAITLQDKLVYDEPPAWYFPVREALGGTWLRAGRPAEAERVFREDLRLNPGNGRSLFGLAEALQAQGRSADAARVAAEFTNAWKKGEIQLSKDTL